ncbi:MAG: nucleotidyltransferase family protein [bacterium]
MKKEKKIRDLKEIKEKLKELKPLLKEKYKIKEIGIFGSYLKGNQTKKSDLDILIDFYEIPDLWTFIEIQEFLSKKLKIKVDLVMKSALKPYIGKVILQEVEFL